MGEPQEPKPFWALMTPASKRLVVTAPRVADAASEPQKSKGGVWIAPRSSSLRVVYGVAAKVISVADDVTVAKPGDIVVFGQYDGMPLGANVEVDAWLITEGSVQGKLPPEYEQVWESAERASHDL